MDEFGNAKAAMTMEGFFKSLLAQTDPVWRARLMMSYSVNKIRLK